MSKETQPVLCFGRYYFLFLIALLVIFIGIFLVARLPFFDEQLQGEEGVFAKILIQKVEGPNYVLAARVNGEEIFCLAEHPALMYETLGHVGRPVHKFLFWLYKEVDSTRVIRFSLTLFQLIVWVGILAVLNLQLGSSISKSGYFFLLSLAVSPLAVSSSLTAQIDGSVGVIFCGAVALTNLYFCFSSTLSGKAFVILFLAGFVLGLGKQEWSISFLAASLLTLMFLFVLNERTLAPYQAIGLELIGVLCGNLISYTYDPSNYLGGIDVIGRITAVFLGGRIKYNYVAQIFDATYSRLVFVAPLLLIGIVVGLFWLRLLFGISNNKEAGLRLGLITNNFLFFLCLFVGYFSSPWCYNEPRYFAPSLMVGAATVAQLFGLRLISGTTLIFFATGLLLLIESSWFLGDAYLRSRTVTINPGITIQKREKCGDRSSTTQDCIPLIDIADVFDKREIDFVASSAGQIAAERLLKKYLKRLCQ